MNFFKKLFNKSKNTKENFSVPKINADTEPDSPQCFGIKTAWYAIKGETPETVIKKLDLVLNCESNWAFGLRYANDYKNKNAVFVSPQIDGYVLVIGNGIFDLVDVEEFEDIEFHAALFSELQFFLSHHVSECHMWAKFDKKHDDRFYGYYGGNGTIPRNYGTLTKEELELGFDKFPQTNDDILLKLQTEDDFGENYEFPEEDNVLEIAKAWGVDTTFQDKQYEKSTGYICHCKWVE